MKYICRIFKYFVKISVLAALVILALSYLKLIPSDINEIFKDGIDSVKKIALMFSAVSCLYPLMGYVTRGVIIPGEFEEIKDDVVAAMGEKGYELYKTEGEDLFFRSANPTKRILSLGDDRLEFHRQYPGYVIEGKAKHVTRIAGFLEYKFRSNE